MTAPALNISGRRLRDGWMWSESIVHTWVGRHLTLIKSYVILPTRRNFVHSCSISANGVGGEAEAQRIKWRRIRFLPYQCK